MDFVLLVTVFQNMINVAFYYGILA